MYLRVVNWNLQWATRRSVRSPEILKRFRQREPHVACFTETDADFMAGCGHTICSLADYGSGIRGNRRKVILWSRNPWRPAGGFGTATLVPGRFVAGVTRTPIGPVTVAGICIPWSGSRTVRFSGRQRQWQDHEEYLDGLKPLLAASDTSNLVVMGDFNQRLEGRSNVPLRLRAKLSAAFPTHLRIATGSVEFESRKTIDHIAATADLSVRTRDPISHRTVDGKALSDHFGVVADLSRTHDPAPTINRNPTGRVEICPSTPVP